MITNRIGYLDLVKRLMGCTAGILLRPASVAFEDILCQIRTIGLGAIPTAVLISATAGFVLALVLEVQLSQLGKVELVPTLLWVILTEQVVPIGVALVFTGRSVSAMTAELGAMQISEEIKALFTMGIDIFPFLLVPRFLGFQIMLPIVTLVCVYASLLGGWILCAVALRMGAGEYIYYAFDEASLSSVIFALVKSILFGFLISTISCYKGLNVRNGSKEISEATTQAVVSSVIVVTLANAGVTLFQLV